MPDPSHIRSREIAQKALQEKRFEAAINALNQAFLGASQTCGNHLVVVNDILDLRVAAYIGLKQHDAAFRDAQSMIRYDRADPRGYLRCGQLCRLKNDYLAAQIWYEQGLKKTSETNKHYATLQGMSSKAAIRLSAQSRSKFRDPFAVLPMDIIYMLTEHLDFRQAVTCLRISKTWHNTLLAIPAIWKTIDLMGTRKKIKKPIIQSCLRRMEMAPTTVRLENLTEAAVVYLRPYIKRWETVEHLSINVPNLITLSHPWTLPARIKTLHIGNQCPVHLRVVDEILHFCHLLQNVRFDSISHICEGAGSSSPNPEVYRSINWKTNLPELRHLVLTGDPFSSRLTSTNLPFLFGDFPNLAVLQCQRLRISGLNADLSTAKYLRRLELENSYIEPNFRLPSSLEVLVCRDCIFTRLSSISIQPPSSLFQKPQQNFEALANLQCLELDSTIVRLPPVFTVLPASLGPILTKLAINSDVMETTALMTSFEAGGLSNLTYLGLYGLNMNNEHIQRITSKCPMLEYVEFRGLMITGVAVKELCLNTAVKTLRLSCCDKVSADAIEWARAKGVSVIVNVSGAHACGRRVRYG